MNLHAALSFILMAVAAPAVRADLVTDWNSQALNAIRIDRTAPPMASRNLATLHAAIYDAANGIQRTHEPYFVTGHVPASASVEAAISAAARKALVGLFPQHQAAWDSAFDMSLAHIPNSPHRKAGVAWGESVASAILEWRATDGSSETWVYVPGTNPGDWQPTPPGFGPYLLPQWALVTPFAMTNCWQYRPAGPPPLTSEAYAVACNEVKLYGGAEGSIRDAEQSEIALFWADGAGTETPPGHWNTIAAQVAAARGNTLEQNARLFALLNIAMADAAICAWDAKYAFNLWRPISAIRNADLDGNPGTEADPNWTPFIATPPFPEYVSGHSTFSGAASTVLAIFWGTDDIAFTTGSDFLPGVYRAFPSFSAAAEEAAVSRLYGGIHFRFANYDGLRGGLDIGDYVSTNFLRPRSNRSRLK
jgi:hypothetical protein